MIVDQRRAKLRLLLAELIDAMDEPAETELDAAVPAIDRPELVSLAVAFQPVLPCAVDLRGACKFCSVSESTLQRWIDEGLITPARSGGRNLFLLDDLRAAVEKLKERPKTPPRGAAKRPSEAQGK